VLTLLVRTSSHAVRCRRLHLVLRRSSSAAAAATPVAVAPRPAPSSSSSTSPSGSVAVIYPRPLRLLPPSMATSASRRLVPQPSPSLLLCWPSDSSTWPTALVGLSFTHAWCWQQRCVPLSKMCPQTSPVRCFVNFFFVCLRMPIAGITDACLRLRRVPVFGKPSAKPRQHRPLPGAHYFDTTTPMTNSALHCTHSSTATSSTPAPRLDIDHEVLRTATSTTTTLPYALG